MSLHQPRQQQQNHAKTAPYGARSAQPIGPSPTGRRRRWLLLAMFSPILLPLVCATFPLLFLSKLLLGTCRQRRRRDDSLLVLGPDDRALRQCEEGCRDEEEREEEVEELGLLLLQRYLEDQIRLVGSVYDCGDDDDDDDDRVDLDGGDCKGGGDSGLDLS